MKENIILNFTEMEYLKTFLKKDLLEAISHKEKCGNELQECKEFYEGYIKRLEILENKLNLLNSLEYKICPI